MDFACTVRLFVPVGRKDQPLKARGSGTFVSSSISSVPETDLALEGWWCR
jgi:hypothetical protein